MAAPVAAAPIGVAAEPARDEAARPSALAERTLAAAIPASAPASTPTMTSVAPPPRPAVVAPKILPASELEKLRVGGDPQPSLPAGAKMIMHRDNVKKISLAVKVCVGEDGVPNSVKLVRSSDYGDANEKVLSDIRKWRFRPYLLNGSPVPVCTAALLSYQLQ
jgi:protein TonB